MGSESFSMKDPKLEYNTFSQEAKRFQAIRICHLIFYNGGKCRTDITRIHTKYTGIITREWSSLSRFCGLKFDITTICYLNPADIGRLGGVSSPFYWENI